MNAQSSIIPFTFENSSTIRTILINDDPWFVSDGSSNAATLLEL